MRIVSVSGGHVAYVDDEDYEQVSRYSWSRLNHGAAQARIGKVRVQMHRFIMNAEPGQFIDHINHNRLDNRRCNLRFATAKENAANRRIPSDRYKGVYDMDSTPCRADARHIKTKRKRYRATAAGRCIGYFATAFEAAQAYDREAIQLFGEFAQLNFPENFFSPDIAT